jgi:short-subunit dehydrogenase
MGAKTVARAGYRGLMKGKTLVIPGLGNWLTVESVRLTPRKVVTAVSRWVSETVE